MHNAATQNVNAFINSCTIYQDESFIAVNKPSGLLSVPGKGDLTDCMINRLKCVYPDALLIHRLDRDTSGILLFARNQHAQTHLSKQFAARQTQKYYQAIVLGHLNGVGEINVPVRYEPLKPPTHVVDLQHPKPAQTYWQALQSVTIDNQKLTPIWLKPITGRSHQLRVHMQHIGHAIADDPLYALNLQQQKPVFNRLALHAARLQFIHPVTLQTIELTNNVQLGEYNFEWLTPNLLEGI